MSLTDILHTARDALNAQQYGLSVTGQNVANVNTVGYAKREALIETQAFGAQSFGTVKVAGLRQAVDQFAERRWFSTTGLAAGAGQRQTDLDSIEALFTDAQGTGLSDSLEAFYGSLTALAANPSDSTV